MRRIPVIAQVYKVYIVAFLQLPADRSPITRGTEQPVQDDQRRRSGIGKLYRM